MKRSDHPKIEGSTMSLLTKILDTNHDWQDETITEEQYDELFPAIIIHYLQNQTPEARQQLMLSWNFDNSHEVLQWIIDQPDSDKGTILYLYWYMQPGFQKRFTDRAECATESSWYLDSFDLLATIEERYTSGFYQHQIYDFDPHYDCYQDGYNWTSELEPETMKREIPQAMFTALHGEILEAEDWDEGVPAELYPIMDRLYELLED